MHEIKITCKNKSTEAQAFAVSVGELVAPSYGVNGHNQLSIDGSLYFSTAQHKEVK